MKHIKAIHLYSFLIFFFLIYIKTITCFFDPYTIVSVGTGIASYLIDHSYCTWKECCNSKGIPANFTQLERELKQNLYGQHLVVDNVISVLRSHWDGETPPKKALVVSFHGWTGGGKNYVVSFIKKALFEKGSESKFVHHYNGRIDFPLEENIQNYKNKLYGEIKKYMQQCSKQLFIFDEVDQMPKGVLDILKPLIDYNEHVDHVNYREAIFIFLSNSGGKLITTHYLKLWKDGINRKDIVLQDFEQLILEGAFNEEGWLHRKQYLNTIVRNLVHHYDMLGWYNSIATLGGLFHSDNIRSDLIDLYIPFLPMEHTHVRLCILDEFKRRGVIYPEENVINEAMESVAFGPDYDKLFAKTGCKRISQRVGLIVKKYRL